MSQDARSNAAAGGRKLARAVTGYGAAMVVAKLTSLVTLPVISWVITPSELGTFAVLNSLLLLSFATLLDLGLDAAALRLAVDEDAAGRRDTFSSLLVARTLLASAIAIVAVGWAPDVSRVLTGTEAHAPLIPWLALSILVGTPARTMSNWLRFQGRHGQLGGVMSTMSLIDAALQIGLVVGLDWGLAGLVIARVGSHVLTLPALLALGRDLRGGRLRLSLLRPMLAFGLPFGLFSALHSLREVDRYLIGHLASFEHAGVYDLSVRIAAPLAAVNLALSLALEPELYRRHDAPGTARRVDAFVRAYACLGGGVAFAAAALSPEIVLLVDPAFRPAVRLIPILLFLELIEGLRRMAGLGGDLAKRTGLWAVVALVNVLVAIPGAVLLLPRWPYLAAPVSLLAGAVLAALTAHALARRVHPIALPIPRALAALLVGAALSWAAAVELAEGALGLLARVALAAAFPIGAALVLKVRAETLRELLGALRRRGERTA